MTSPWGGKPAPVFIRGQDGPLAVTIPGGADFEDMLRIGAGLKPGYVLDILIGLNRATPAALSDIWGAGVNIVHATAGEQWEISSTSAADTFFGTGAQLVAVLYLDTNYVSQAEVVAMNGLAAVTLTATDSFRPIRVIVVQAGASVDMTNQGDITVQVVGGGAIRNFMEAGFGFSFDGHYTIPAATTGFILNEPETNPGRGDGVEVRIRRSLGDRPVFAVFRYQNLFETAFGSHLEIPFGISEKTDLIAQALNTGGGVADVFLTALVLLVDNGILS
jgi:hypothetical protein